jgi:hypothetical protein
MLVSILYGVGSAILLAAGIIGAVQAKGGPGLLLGVVAGLYCTANILLFIVLPNLK